MSSPFLPDRASSIPVDPSRSAPREVAVSSSGALPFPLSGHARRRSAALLGRSLPRRGHGGAGGSRHGAEGRFRVPGDGTACASSARDRAPADRPVDHADAALEGREGGHHRLRLRRRCDPALRHDPDRLTQPPFLEHDPRPLRRPRGLPLDGRAASSACATDSVERSPVAGDCGAPVHSIPSETPKTPINGAARGLLSLVA